MPKKVETPSTELIKAFWEKKANERHYWTDFRASSTGECVRRVWYEMNMQGVPHAKREWYEGMPAHVGNRTHNWVRRDMRAAGINLESIERELCKAYEVELGGRTSRFNVRGHVDGLIDGRVLWDLKTMSKARWTEWHTSGSSLVWVRFPKVKLQMLMYMSLLDIEEAEVWALNRDNGDLSPATLEFTEENKQELSDRLAVIAQVIEGNREPERPYVPTSYDCKVCPFRHHCHGKDAKELYRRR